jgi:hypothetical protein
MSDDKETRYNQFIYKKLNSHLLAPRTLFTCTFTPATPWGRHIQLALYEAEVLYAQDLLRKNIAAGVKGAIVEFGVFEGRWMKTLIDAALETSPCPEVWGFDSFEGLPKLSSADLDCWEAGQYAANYEGVRAFLNADERPWVHLIKGWFKDTLRSSQAQSMGPVAFARVDCDLYEPAAESLDFLSTRLVDGAILVFDDWTYDLAKGETRAFSEWLDKVPNLKFKFLEANQIGSFYLRVSKAITDA